MQRLFVLLVSIIIYNSGFSQERAGLVLGQYNGINALSLNPTNAFNSANKWDIQLAGGQLFANTNYAQITNTNLIKLLKNNSEVFIPQSSNDIVPDGSGMVMNFNETGRTYAEAKAAALGPGLLISLGKNIKAGFSTKARAMISSYNIPSALNYYNANNLEVDSIYTFEEVAVSGMAWTEFNLHYAQQLNSKVSVGGTLKYLRGYGSFSARNEVAFDFEEISQDNIDINSSGRFNIAYPMDKKLKYAGDGVGIDLGVTIKDVFMKGGSLGLSIIDLGLFHVEAYKYTYLFDETLNIDGGIYRDLSEIEEVQNQLARDFEIDHNNDTNPFHNMQLPTALSLQYQLPISDQLKIEGYWVQRIKYLPNGQATSRANSLNVSGVYDRKHFSAFLPLTLYNYSSVRVGAAIRLGYLTIGSDNVLSLFGNRDFSGTDIYANVQVYPFKLSGKEKKSKTDGGVQCYW